MQHKGQVCNSGSTFFWVMNHDETAYPYLMVDTKGRGDGSFHSIFSVCFGGWGVGGVRVGGVAETM